MHTSVLGMAYVPLGEELANLLKLSLSTMSGLGTAPVPLGTGDGVNPADWWPGLGALVPSGTGNGASPTGNKVN